MNTQAKLRVVLLMILAVVCMVLIFISEEFMTKVYLLGVMIVAMIIIFVIAIQKFAKRGKQAVLVGVIAMGLSALLSLYYYSKIVEQREQLDEQFQERSK